VNPPLLFSFLFLQQEIKLNILNIDFNELYMKQKQQSTFKPKSSQDWDKKAVNISKRIYNSLFHCYAQIFKSGSKKKKNK